MSVLDKALLIAYHAHEGQLRKYSNEPYIIHPIGVAKHVKDFGLEDENALASAILHDVVEDTDVTLQEIEDECGPIVAHYVDCLSKPTEGTKEEINQAYLVKLETAPFFVRIVKFMDIFHNYNDLAKIDPERFAKKIPVLKERLKVMNLEEVSFSNPEWDNLYLKIMGG